MHYGLYDDSKDNINKDNEYSYLNGDLLDNNLTFNNISKKTYKE